MTDATESHRTASKAIDAKMFWRVLGERAVGATIVTARGADGPSGFLGLSATHICADPPTALGAVLHARHFAINYLGRDALALADMFAGKSAIKGADRFEQDRWGTLTTGAPVFADAIGVLDCELEKTIEHFATTIAIGRVVDLVARGSGDPLIYFRGGFYSG